MEVDGNAIAPMVTWGNSPQDVVAVNGSLPDPAQESIAEKQAEMEAAYDYMGLKPGPQSPTLLSTGCLSVPVPMLASRICVLRLRLRKGVLQKYRRWLCRALG